MINREDLLKLLPPFENKWELVSSNQTVSDIVAQILSAHEQYKKYYDCIALKFDADKVEDITGNIISFLENNIKYKEEPDSKQTTAIPTAILTFGKGDCKHYASFAGGVLDALTRLTGEKINWCYRFVSYSLTKKTPHHVFVVVFTPDYELWIDPTPDADKVTPVWIIDKKIKQSSMPLYNIVSGTQQADASIGWTLKEKLAHAAAKIPMAAGRIAFLTMLKLNVRAWAKNIHDMVAEKKNVASDPIGRTWYLLGGDAAPFWEAVKEGSTKKMLGNVNAVGAVDIAALLVAATPIVVAITSVVKSVMNKPDFEQGQLLYPGTDGTNTLPPANLPTSTGIMDWIKQNPMPSLAVAGVAAYLLWPKGKKRVTGTDNNTLLLVGAGIGLYFLLRKNEDPVVDVPIAVIDDGIITLPPAEITDPVVDPPVETVDYGGGGGSADVPVLPVDWDYAPKDDLLYTGDEKHEYLDTTLLTSNYTV